MNFWEILDLNTPNTREKYLLKTKCLDFFSLQATAVDRCEALDVRSPWMESKQSNNPYKMFNIKFVKSGSNIAQFTKL